MITINLKENAPQKILELIEDRIKFYDDQISRIDPLDYTQEFKSKLQGHYVRERDILSNAKADITTSIEEIENIENQIP